jgi:glycerol-1-phosphate dehydrogenase [NAD(P)+]
LDINQLLSGVVCACGRSHECAIKSVYIENGAIDKLRDICTEYKSVLIVADERTYAVAGEKTLSALSKKSIKKTVFPGNKILIPDEVAIATVEDELAAVDLIVGIGSGVIQDLCKYVAHYNNLPYLVVATAPSMDGYASNGAAMITGGMKVTYPAGLPIAIVADTAVLSNAPLDMIRSGYGDIIGKFSALNDWKLSRLINGEYFCDYIYDATYEQIILTINSAEGILSRDEDSIRQLMEALVIIGIMMSFAGSSRPASGSEHHLSHFFEITGIVDGKDYLPHGTDVAYSTLVTAKIREWISARQFPNKIYRKSDEDYVNDIKSIYKSSADECIKLQKSAGNYTAERLGVYLKHEKEIKNLLSEMPSSEYILGLLSNAGFDINYFYSFYGVKKIKNATLYAKDLKDRYTVLWLYFDLFGDLSLF